MPHLAERNAELLVEPAQPLQRAVIIDRLAHGRGARSSVITRCALPSA